jgi:hypothetical protein
MPIKIKPITIWMPRLKINTIGIIEEINNVLALILVYVISIPTPERAKCY